MPSQTHVKDEHAIKLALALTRLRARMREESKMDAFGLSLTQLSILKRLRFNGQETAASLAGAEHITQQAIAQCMVALKSAGLVKTKPDPTDRRKTLIVITEAGQKLRDSLTASRNSWLSSAIASVIEPHELSSLDKTVELLERLADAE
jgi:DNA-binding MarR family transcriptional regulator